jgi:Lytic transglycolase/Putative peptidoglycan binding domain
MTQPNPVRARAACATAMLALTALIAAGTPSLPGTAPEAAQAAGAIYENYAFGARDLRLGDRGEDVRILNWVLRSQALSTPPHGDFVSKTDSAVRRLQRTAGVKANGVVRRDTRKALAARMVNQRATWYGPGFWGNTTACGKTLTKKTLGVAHRKLPCGTHVAFASKGRWVRAKMIDRGPYRSGYRWDLTQRLAKRLGVINAGTATIKSGVAP